MARFGSEAELAAFLSNLDPDYAQYAPALWPKGVRTPTQLSSFSEPHYLACDVLEAHIDDIKKRAEGPGELLACNNLYKPTLARISFWNSGDCDVTVYCWRILNLTAAW